MKVLAVFCVLWACTASLPAQAPSEEDRALRKALAEAGTSAVDAVQALEQHLEKYPKSPRRAEIERVLARTAIETDDQRRIILYGERVLAREAGDIKLLDRVSRALLSSNDREPSERALKYAARYEQALREAEKEKPSDRISAARWRDEIERGFGRAYVLQARAQGNLGHTDAALALARKSFETYPNAESAREIGRWLSRTGREQEAIAHYADAFTISDPRTRDSDRSADRARMGELYRELHGSEQGLGDIVLEAYDRNAGLIGERQLRLKALDPNAQASAPLDFTLTGLKGDKLPLSQLKGKVVILDFWATWCGPCRVQHPLYQQVKQRFKGRDDVVFLSINTDEDRSTVASFIEENRWDQRVYFEDGLSAALQIASIPTAVLINKRGEVQNRLNGFIPDRFVDMLSERIEKALNE